MKDKITCFKLNWYDCGLCCAEHIVQEEIAIYRNLNRLVFKEMNGYGVVCSCEIIPIRKDMVTSFFDFLETNADKWEAGYSVEVCDGSSWSIRLWHSSHRVKKVRGTIEYPPNGAQIEKYIRSFIPDEKSHIAPKCFGCS